MTATFTVRSNTDEYTLDLAAGQYRDGQGKLVPWPVIREAVEALVAGSKLEAATLAETLRRQHSTDPAGAVRRFGAAMLLLLTALHRASAMAARSGASGLLIAAEADLDAMMRRERGYLSGFLALLYGLTLITRGQPQPPQGITLVGTLDVDTIARRAGAYMDNGLITYERQRYMLHVFLDYTEGRRVLNPEAEHCRGCEEQAALGWTPLAQVRPLGYEECEQWCKCDLEYRRFSIHGA